MKYEIPKMSLPLPIPTIFAHRGASAYAPENTIAAFVLAVKQEANAVELDAKLTADGEVVVFHDQNVERTTGSRGRVGELTLAELRKLDAGSHFDVSFRGEPIPTLSDVFEAVGKKIFINIELTNYASVNDSLPDKVAALVSKYDLAEWVMFSSFNPIALWRVRRLLPQIPTGLLALQGKNGALARSFLGRLLAYDALHPYLGDVTPRLVNKTHHRGCRVHVYTVNQADDMRHLISLGVDGIFTDDPVMAKNVFNSPVLSQSQRSG
jgi:glycerophosphoryl diester phosphodiesterase